jgi:hypothetical protein
MTSRVTTLRNPEGQHLRPHGVRDVTWRGPPPHTQNKNEEGVRMTKGELHKGTEAPKIPVVGIAVSGGVLKWWRWGIG